MPVTKTAAIWIELSPLNGLKDRFQLPRLFFWDDGARPYWAFEAEGSKAYIPTSRESAYNEGLLILWSTLFDDSTALKEDPLNAFAPGKSPVILAEHPDLTRLVAAAKESLKAFKLQFSVESGSYVIAP